MLIISTCILVAQTATASPSQQVDVTALAERLESMMESADMDTAAITTELASAAGIEKPSPEQISQLETRVQRMLSRGDASYKALTNGLTKVNPKCAKLWEMHPLSKDASANFLGQCVFCFELAQYTS